MKDYQWSPWNIHLSGIYVVLCLGNASFLHPDHVSCSHWGVHSCFVTLFLLFSHFWLTVVNNVIIGQLCALAAVALRKRVFVAIIAGFDQSRVWEVMLLLGQDKRKTVAIMQCHWDVSHCEKSICTIVNKHLALTHNKSHNHWFPIRIRSIQSNNIWQCYSFNLVITSPFKKARGETWCKPSRVSNVPTMQIHSCSGEVSHFWLHTVSHAALALTTHPWFVSALHL